MTTVPPLPVTPELRLRAKTLDAAVIGARLKEARQRAGMTQTEAAGESMSTAYISRIEAGQRRASIELLTLLASRLGCDLGVLLEDATEVVDPEVLARLTLELDFAELSLKTGDGHGGLEKVMRVLEQPDVPTEVEHKARYLQALGLESTGQLDRAVMVLEDVVAARPDGVPLLEALIALSRCYREQGDLARACDVGERATALVDEVQLQGSAEGIQLAVTVAAAHFERGDVHHALRLCLRAMEAAEELESPAARASAYWNTAVMHSLRGDVTSALPLAQRAIALLEAGTDARNRARLRVQVGMLQLELEPAELEGAVLNFQLADAELLTTDAATTDRARVRLGLARARLLEGDGLEAERLAEECFSMAADSALLRAEARLVVGRVHSHRGDLEAAVQQFRRAILELSGVGADRQAAQLWFELGSHLREHGAIEDAAEAYQRAAASTGLTAVKPMRTSSGDARAAGSVREAGRS